MKETVKVLYTMAVMGLWWAWGSIYNFQSTGADPISVFAVLGTIGLIVWCLWNLIIDWHTLYNK